uniref:Ephrin RBD domain-containing protein n=1 Tax=Mesocestoides corti TaxID=53468 RepID=A0A5K3F5G0_MESCO
MTQDQDLALLFHGCSPTPSTLLTIGERRTCKAFTLIEPVNLCILVTPNECPPTAFDQSHLAFKKCQQYTFVLSFCIEGNFFSEEGVYFRFCRVKPRAVLLLLLPIFKTAKRLWLLTVNSQTANQPVGPSTFPPRDKLFYQFDRRGHPLTTVSRSVNFLKFRALGPSSSISSRSHLPHWLSMPPHSPLAAYTPELAPDYSATEVALGCVTSPSNNNYAYNLFIHRSAQLACCRSSTCCSRQFRHYPTTTTTCELQDQHHPCSMPVS